MLYPLQARQASVLRKMGMCWQVESLSLKNIEECRRYIDKQLGLREDYADYMARCFWEVCSPVVNNTWHAMGIYPLDIEYDIRSKLGGAGIDTFGKLCKLTYKELSEIKGIGTQNAERIDTILTKMGLALSE